MRCSKSITWQKFMLHPNKVIERQIFIDPLTGLPNRTKLVNDIPHNQYKQLILVNLDDFKEVNDFFGNKTGDHILQEISKIMLNHLPSKTFNIYKLHADEFAILPLKTINRKNMHKIIFNLYQKISKTNYVHNNLDINISLSMGISESKANLLEETDMALRYAKENKKHFIFFEKSMGLKKAYAQNIKRGNMLKDAIKKGRIIPVFQPIINNKTKKI